MQRILSSSKGLSIVRTISGQNQQREKCDPKLLALYDSLWKGPTEDGKVSRSDVDKLWEAAHEGKTEREQNTLQYFLSSQGHLTPKAHTYLSELMKNGGASLFTSIDGVKYDRTLLEKGKELAKKHGRLILRDARSLYELAQDGPGVTDTEKRTLALIYNSHDLDSAADAFVKKNGLGPEERKKLAPTLPLASAAENTPELVAFQRMPSTMTVYQQAKKIGIGRIHTGLSDKQAEDLWILYAKNAKGSLVHQEVLGFLGDVVKAKFEELGVGQPEKARILREMLQDPEALERLSKKLDLTQDGEIDKAKFVALCRRGFHVDPEERHDAEEEPAGPPAKRVRVDFERRLAMGRCIGWEDTTIIRSSLLEVCTRVDKALVA
eukprot:CAMPEP_0170605380 /NCGR_PEP_ID=MMETSP0224-20130122/19944_1 /TAXON_ID=285029 /ORGANISM="Togula jolla, Strain CCCM 725" /LENGTH=378 /DNA_ID=CAMNT_0010930383 /DNA_START=23 /DNA_END=1156 /DNA_ORIENTATION=+